MSKKVSDSFFEDETAEVEELSLFQKIGKWAKELGKPKEKTLTPDDEDFYGGATQDEEANPYIEDEPKSRKKALAKQKKGKKKRSKQEFLWWEWLIVLVEVALIVYTILVFLRLAPIF